MQLKQQLEPYMRITVQIPKDAAQRLRQLAAESNATLRALGIRSVQVEGDSVISLNVGGQQIDVKTTDSASLLGHAASGTSMGAMGANTTDISDLSQLLAGGLGGAASTSGNSAFAQVPQVSQQSLSMAMLQQQQQQRAVATGVTNFVQNTSAVGGDTLSLQQQQILQQRRNIMLGGPSTSNAAIKQQQVIYSPSGNNQQDVFKSPNTVCPMDGKVPVPPLPVGTNSMGNSREFPFESMRQARVLQGRDNALNAPGPSPPGPGPGGITLTGKGMQQPQLLGSLGPPPNVALKVLKNPQSGEIITTSVPTNSGKTQFLQPPPPPYPGVGNATTAASNSTAGGVNKQITNYMSSRVVSTPAPTGKSMPPTNGGTNNMSNNIAMSSPLLVNLLQNDNNSMSTQSSNHLKSPSLPSPQQQQQQQGVMHQQQQSPMMSVMSPQQQLMNSPLRTGTPGSDFVMPPQQQQSQQQLQTQVSQQICPGVPGTPDAILNVPSSPTASSSAVMRNNLQGAQQQQQQQVMLSPSSSNMYVQQQRFQQQQMSPQQAALLRQQQLQRQQQHMQGTGTAIAQQQQRYIQQQSTQHQMLQQPIGPNTMLTIQQQQQMRQVRVGNPGGMQQVPQANIQQHQRLISMSAPGKQQYMAANSTGNMSPATAHSPASSHHSMHSPLMASHSSHQQQQQMLSPSTTPAQSPLTASSQMPQQLLPPPPSPSSTGLAHNPSAHHIVPSSPSASGGLPPPPDYNQVAGSGSVGSRWPAALNKPMDSATKSSFQEFTRYQIQYNLQQQQTQQQEQQIISDIANSLPGATPETCKTPTTEVIGNLNAVPTASSAGSGQVMDGSLDANNVDDLTDPLISLSDLEALTTNDLDALLPTLSCDIDSSLSLDDKNELESLLQDAKDLDLDLIEGMDIDETAAAATSLLSGDEQIPANMALAMEQMQQQQSQSQPQQQQQQQLNMQQQLLHHGVMQQNHQRQLVTQQQQQQSQLILQQRLQQQPAQQPMNQNPVPQQQFLINPNQHQQQQRQFIMQHQHLNHIASKPASGGSSAGSNPPPTSSHQKQFLINPLTGEMEPSPSDDSDTEAEQETQSNAHSGSVNISMNSVFSANTNNSIYDLLTNSSHFSEDSNSNSCSTALSKLSNTDHNNGGSITPLLLGAGSDTERSRDSSISNKSQSKNKKTKANAAANSLCNKPGDMASPRSASSSPSVQAMMAGNANAANKKSKTNLLREKLQQGVREKKSKAATNAANATPKPKKERAKASTKAKQTSATQQKQNPTTSTPNSASAASAPVNTIASADQLHSQAASANTTEKIKLRLKLEKSEPVSPAYKVDVSFGSENVQQQQSQLNSHLLSNNLMQHSAQQQQQFHSNVNFNNAHPSHSQQQQPQPQHHQQQSQHHLQPLHPQHQSNPPQYQMNQQESLFPQPGTSNTNTANTANPISSTPLTADEQPRVPPLHISLRGGKNSIVIKNSRKERKKAQVASTNTQDTIHAAEGGMDSKSKPPLKRSHATTTGDIVSVVESGDGLSGTEAKQTKHVSQMLKNQQMNGVATVAESGQNAVPGSTNSALVSGKNGLTISAMNSLDAGKTQPLIDHHNLGSTHIGTVSHLPPQQLLQPSTQQQLAKITSLPNSITLSTISNPNSSPGGMSGVSSNLQIKHSLKTTATITPIQGKPIAKNHKPPSYITAVQQLQLQKQQQQQQLAALAEKQTQQQMIAAAVTMLPSATTLKRVEITKVERKDAAGKVIEHVLVKSNEPVISSTSTSTAQSSSIIQGTSTTIKATQIVSSAASSNNGTSSTTVVASAGAKTDIHGKSGPRKEKVSGSTLTENTMTGNSNTSSISITSTTSAALTAVSVGSTNVSYTTASLVATLRNSPASTGGGTPAHTNSTGGEDSGIESMDALSEKSPHQLTSCSPQSLLQTQLAEKQTSQTIAKTTKPSESSKAPSEDITQLEMADDEIEKALAKMEGFADDDCDIGGDIKLDQSNNKMNGDHSKFDDQLKKEGGGYHHHLHHHSVDDEDDDEDDLIKNLTASIIEEHEAGEKAAKEKLENELKEKEKKEKGESPMLDIKDEDIKQQFSQAKSLNMLDVKPEINYNNNYNKVATEIKTENPQDSLVKTEGTNGTPNNSHSQRKDDSVKSELTVSLAPISIEIPSHPDVDSPRIRTRASSRLGSPMDAKSSPLLDTAAIATANTVTAKNKHVTAAKSSSTHDRNSPSPKVQPNPPASTASTPATTTATLSSTSTTSTSNTTTNANNHNKRKRMESEGTSGSAVNETDAKRTRSSSTSGNGASPDATTAQDSETSGNVNKKSDLDNSSSKSAPCVPKKIEESSDSDEPLIEIAGKVRNSKAAIAGGMDATSCNTNSSPITVEISHEKITRHSRSHQQPQNKTASSSTTASATHPTPVSENSTMTNHGKTVKHSASNPANATQVNHSTPVAPVNVTANSAAPTHATRGTVHAANAAAHSTNSTHGHASTNATTSPSEIEKIGTRRSVRASAAANKMIYTRGSGNTAHASSTNSSAEGASRSAAPTKSNTSASSESVAEARRKTRSAVIGESLLTEGRRRRGSRDFK